MSFVSESVLIASLLGLPPNSASGEMSSLQREVIFRSPLKSRLLFPSLPAVAPGLLCDPGGDLALLVLPADPGQGCAFHRHRCLHPGDGLHGGRGRAGGQAPGSR